MRQTTYPLSIVRMQARLFRFQTLSCPLLPLASMSSPALTSSARTSDRCPCTSTVESRFDSTGSEDFGLPVDGGSGIECDSSVLVVKWSKRLSVGLMVEDDVASGLLSDGNENDLILAEPWTWVQSANRSPHVYSFSSGTASVSPFFSAARFLRRSFFFSISLSVRIRRTESVLSEVRMKRRGWVGWYLMCVIGDEDVGRGNVDRGWMNVGNWRESDQEEGG